MRFSRRTILTVIASAMFPAAIGCSTLSKSDTAKDGSAFSRFSWFNQDKEKAPEPYPNPVKLIATWTPDTLLQTGRTPTRGFGGRLYFYNEKSKAVPVDGTLVVHGFDENTSDPSQQVKRFAFTPEQFTRHFSQSDLGASYSVWIPWDAVGGDSRKISLVATFTTESGKTVQGVPTAVLLPGPKVDQEEQLADKLSPDFRRWQRVAAGETPQPSGLTTTTIPRARRPVIEDGPPEPARGGNRAMMAEGTSTPSAEIGNPSKRTSIDAIPASSRSLRER